MKTLFPTHLLPLLASLALGLSACSEPPPGDAGDAGARALVMDAIKAHGGKERWYGSGLLHFRWTYHMTDRGPDAVVDTRQSFDPKSMAVVHEVPGSETRFGWKDGTAWIHPPDATFAPPPRFWALTPIYFVGMPFVLDDPNARFEKLPKTMEFEGKDYTQVKVTFTEEAGESPDDYYVLLIEPETKLLRGMYYIVTHPLIAQGEPGPPKFITLDGLRDVGGVLLATSHRSFEMNDGAIGKQIRHTDVSELKWLPRGQADLSIPEGAKRL